MGVSIGRQFGAGQAIPAPAMSRAARQPRRRSRLGLSARLFLVTVAFVALAEIMIYVPAVASYRKSWLADRMTAAAVAALVLDATPDHHVSDALVQRLLAGVGAREIAVEGSGGRRVLALTPSPDAVAESVDLRGSGWFEAIVGSWNTLTSPEPAAIRVVGSGRDSAGKIEVVLDELPLRQALAAFSLRLLISSLVIATAAAALVFFVLQCVFVRPMRRLARNIADFADNPEKAERVIAPSGRIDEIGEAEAALARMEVVLAGELRHKRRLAGLGLSVSKISHELRNLLTTAQLLGDRLENVADPVVQRVAPRLVATLDRANRFCEATLAYGRAAERHPQRAMVPLARILDELPDLAALSRDARVRISIRSQPGLGVDADAEQLSRALTNLVRNAVQALDAAGGMSPTVTVEARREGCLGTGLVTIAVTDNGPGLPDRAKAHLFSPFQGSMRAGGTGLGLAIAAELAELNGGTLRLDPTDTGARFLLEIPDRQAHAEAA
ncbi:HAMP domain-containing histidine kinase [Methylobacterium sp. WL9]|nr:HAMP domain-containing histidine kinase [Methylobacterium sp. WL9]